MFLYYGVVALHIIVCVILVLVVLLQSGKSADLAGAFGGGATQTAFGSRGPASFLSKMTTASAALFMLTSMGLVLMSSKKNEKSILETTGQPAATQPAQKSPAQNKPNAPVLTPEQIQQRVDELKRKQQNQAAPAPTAPKPEQPAAPADSKPAR